MHPPTALVVHDRPSSYQAVRGVLEGDPQDLHQLDAAIRNIRVRLEQSAGQES